jgi:hypothetical protein
MVTSGLAQLLTQNQLLLHTSADADACTILPLHESSELPLTRRQQQLRLELCTSPMPLNHSRRVCPNPCCPVTLKASVCTHQEVSAAALILPQQC